MIIHLTYYAWKWLFSNNDSQIIRVIGPIPLPNEPIRAILLWSENCEFSQADAELIRWAKREFIGSLVLIINCDCEKHDDTGMPEEFTNQTLLLRKNIGYDWCGYRDLIMYFGMEKRPFLTLLNNSVIPVTQNPAFLSEQEDLALGINGISGAVESKSPRRHLQSFSLTFSNAALRSPVVEWIRHTKNVSNKWAMVYFREVRLWGISVRLKLPIQAVLSDQDIRLFAKNNFQITSHFGNTAEYQNISDRIIRGKSLNPTHHLWRFLLALKFPFIKKELVLRNPARMPDVGLAREIIGEFYND
jgi:hypothetical protein